MKAARINEYGGPSVIKIDNIEAPVTGEGQVLVEVHAASINPFDTSVRTGLMKEMIPLNFPVTLGGDIAGIVTESGPGADGFSVGDKVYGQANVVAGNSGAFAEFAATAAGQIAKMPESLDFEQAASLPLAGASAWQALTKHINLQPGHKIFIHGGSGGIGSIAIQIAKNIGAHIATTATEDRIDYVKQLGADEVIDYKTQDFADILNGYDAVFDTVGREDFNKSLTVLKKGGTAVSMIAPADEAKAGELGVKAITQGTKVTTEALNELTKLVEAGVVSPQVDKVFHLDRIYEAFEFKEKGAIKGKVVIKMK